MKNSQIPNETFETSAWKAVLADGLVSRMHEDDAESLIDTYRAIEQAQKHLFQLIEIAGQQSSLEGSAQLRGQYRTSLTITLEELTPRLQRLANAG